MSLTFSQVKWRAFVLVLAFQALTVMEFSTAGQVNAFLFKNIYKNTREPYGYRGGPLGKPLLDKPLLHGFIKGLFYRPPEYQYGPDEIPFIFYS